MFLSVKGKKICLEVILHECLFTKKRVYTEKKLTCWSVSTAGVDFHINLIEEGEGENSQKMIPPTDIELSWYLL